MKTLNIANNPEHRAEQLKKVDADTERLSIHLKKPGMEHDYRAKKKLERLINLKGRLQQEETKNVNSK
ncbi:MAG: hypothetical protein AAB870_01705 [Patescibacteria group bacterium]